jgi:chloramphenicol-sensitive protein RarD
MSNFSHENLKGYRFAILAYGAWGLFPLYWKMLKAVPPVEILLHRVVWSWLFYSLIQIVWTKKLPRLPKISAGDFQRISLASLFLGLNWFLYIYAVNSGHIVESSLGYFIIPILNALLGVVLLKERLQSYHKVALALCAVGVLVLTLDAGRPPWIAFGLAVSFSLYGLIKKRIPMPSVRAGQWESFLLILPLVAGLLIEQHRFQEYSPFQAALLLGAGAVTGLPLLWFSEAAKRLPYFVMGLFQYLSPSLQFLVGVAVFHEPVSRGKGLGFLFIWAGIAWILRGSLQGNRVPARNRFRARH